MKRWLLPIAVLILILGVVGWLVRDRLRPKVAGLKVEAEPAAAVYVDGNQVGTSPYSAEMKPGEVTVKLVPMTTTTPLPPYEVKVKLEAGVQTVVRRWFGASEELSSGETVSLEKYDSKEKGKGGLVVVSTPDAAAVRLNGVLKGFTPLVQDGVVAGEYQLAVAAAGWREKVIRVRVEGGHRLSLTVKLAKEEVTVEEMSQKEATASGEKKELTPTPTGKVMKKPYVEIGETPTGWVRVRAEASTAARELAKVNTGEKYALAEKAGTGWYKIVYAEGKEGWVTAQYAKLVE